jgi:hypothetical protein
MTSPKKTTTSVTRTARRNTSTTPRHRASATGPFPTGRESSIFYEGGWKPSIHMPRWASRLTLEMTSVRVEQLKDISEEDAKAEGAVFTDWGKHCHTLSCDGGETWGHVHTQKAGWHFGDASSHEHCLGTARMAFANIWNHVYGVDAWDRNEWVWAISFKRASP